MFVCLIQSGDSRWPYGPSLESNIANPIPSQRLCSDMLKAEDTQTPSDHNLSTAGIEAECIVLWETKENCERAGYCIICLTSSVWEQPECTTSIQL
jgi:hypothetical protein